MKEIRITDIKDKFKNATQGNALMHILTQIGAAHQLRREKYRALVFEVHDDAPERIAAFVRELFNL